MSAKFFIKFLSALLGYGVPAYECFQSFRRQRQPQRRRRPRSNSTPQFWCGFCIALFILLIVEETMGAVLAMSERIPMYCALKLMFIVYLWHPRTRGADTVHKTIFLPLLMLFKQLWMESSRLTPLLIFYMKLLDESADGFALAVARRIKRPLEKPPPTPHRIWEMDIYKKRGHDFVESERRGDDTILGIWDAVGVGKNTILNIIRRSADAARRAPAAEGDLYYSERGRVRRHGEAGQRRRDAVPRGKTTRGASSGVFGSMDHPSIQP